MKVLLILLLTYSCVSCYGAEYMIGGTVYDNANRPNIEQKIAILEQDANTCDSRFSLQNRTIGGGDRQEILQISDKAGRFQFTGLREGMYVLIILDDPVQGKKYDSVNYSPVIIQLTNSVTNLCITPSVIDYVEISGHILSVHSGEPIMAEIEFSPEDIDKMPSSASWMIDFSKTVSTDESGAFVKARVPIGVYYMTIFNMDEAKYKRSRVSIKIAVQRLNEPIISEQYRQYLDEMGLVVDVHMAAPGGHAILIDGNQNEE